MTGHTPGPWTADDFVVRKDVDGFVTFVGECQVAGIGIEAARSNTRLVAAAPDLLEALKAMVAVADGDDWDTNDLSDLEMGRAAIRKAEGRES